MEFNIHRQFAYNWPDISRTKECRGTSGPPLALYDPEMALDWNAEIVDQIESQWRHQLRPRLEGLTDKEYFLAAGSRMLDDQSARDECGTGVARRRRLHLGLRAVRGRRTGDQHCLATRPRDRGSRGDERHPLRRPGHKRRVPRVRRHRHGRATSTRCLVRALGRRCPSPRRSCSPAWRSSTTAPRSACCGICI